MTRYLLITSTLNDVPFAVWLEDSKKLSAHYGDPETNGYEERAAEAFKRTKLEDLIGRNLSYYSTEIGEYEGSKKVEIDSVIKKLESKTSSSSKKSISGEIRLDLKGLAGIVPNAPGGSSGNRVLKPAAFDPRSIDADGDGWRQEGTTARWFGAGLNNPMYKELKNQISYFNVRGMSDSEREEIINLARSTTERINAPKPEESNLITDMTFIVGHRINSEKITPETYSFYINEDAIWVLGRDEERRALKGPKKKPGETLVDSGKSKVAEFKKRVEERKKARVERDKKVQEMKSVQVDKRTLERARNFVLNDSSDLELYKMFTFDFEDRNGKKYSVKIDKADAGDIWGKILDENGDTAADFHRKLVVDDDGNLYIDHMRLVVNEKYKKSGIATIFNARNEQVYSAMGAKRVDVYAASDPDAWSGASHWPKVGFDWSNEKEKEKMLKVIDKALKDYEDGLEKGEDSPTFKIWERDSDGSLTGSMVDVPIFHSQEEAEELAILVAMARDQAFDENNRLVAGDFVNWTSAEWWMKMSSLGISYSQPVTSDPKRGDKPHKKGEKTSASSDNWVM